VGVKGLLTTVLDYYPDFEFNDEDITILITPPIRFSPNTSLTPQPQRQVGGPTTYSWATSSLRERPDHAAARGPKHRRSGLRAAPGDTHDLPEPTNEIYAF
jgi:hypothetical protein